MSYLWMYLAGLLLALAIYVLNPDIREWRLAVCIFMFVTAIWMIRYSIILHFE